MMGLQTQHAIFTRPTKSQAVFGISTSTLYRWAKLDNSFEIKKRGGCAYVRTEEVLAFMDKSENPLGDRLGDKNSRT